MDSKLGKIGFKKKTTYFKKENRGVHYMIEGNQN